MASVIVGFCNSRVTAKGDVRKMYNAVVLKEGDCYVQCFLWRDMDEKKVPDTYQVTVNNIGVKPAGAIATTALYKSCDWFEDNFPEVVVQIKHESFVNVIGLTDLDVGGLAEKTQQADKILRHANMKVKKWIVLGESGRN